MSLMEVEKLLYVTGISHPSFSEVERLLALRTVGLREVIFLHTANGEGWETELAAHDVNSKTLRVDGPLVSCIVKAARQEAVPLIAASVNKADGRQRHRKSLTKNLLRSSPVPVIILPAADEPSVSGQEGVFGHVIFATDWSTASKRALDYVVNFKEIIKALEIVHVIDKRLSVKDMRDLKDKLAQTRGRLLDMGIDAESHIYAGRPSEEIMLAARDYDATCIVMGSSGKSGLKELFSSSYGYRVAGASVVPTLVVP